MISRILFNVASKTINETKQNLYYQVTNVQYVVEGNELLLEQNWDIQIRNVFWIEA